MRWIWAVRDPEIIIIKTKISHAAGASILWEAYMKINKKRLFAISDSCREQNNGESEPQMHFWKERWELIRYFKKQKQEIYRLVRVSQILFIPLPKE